MTNSGQSSDDYFYNKDGSLTLKGKTGKRQTVRFRDNQVSIEERAQDELRDDHHQADELTSKEYHNTDMGNAERLVDRYGDVIRFCYEWNKWLTWDGVKWDKDDSSNGITQKAKDTAKSIYTEASETEDSGKRKELAKFALSCEQAFNLEQMIKLAKCEVAIKPDVLDTNKWLLNCQNGTVDLKTGELLAHNKEHLITKVLPIGYNSSAKCKRWLSFLSEVMNGNQDLISFLKRAVGMSLTGDASERIIFILYGTGKNGKTTFLSTIQTILGDYAQQVPIEALMAGRHTGASEDIARLFQVRFAIATEGKEGQRLNEGLLKQLSGNDKVAARYLYGHTFEFFPTHKSWLASNYKPMIKETADAIWDRVKLIPFQIAIPEEKQDKHLINKLLVEAAGILAWAVEGCLEWQRDGIGIPPEVKKATEAYREEMDIIGNWLKECCIVERCCNTLAKSLYQSYEQWCNESGEQLVSKKEFGSRLVEKGFIKGHNSKNSVTWQGIGLETES